MSYQTISQTLFRVSQFLRGNGIMLFRFGFRVLSLATAACLVGLTLVGACSNNSSGNLAGTCTLAGNRCQFGCSFTVWLRQLQRGH